MPLPRCKKSLDRRKDKTKVIMKQAFFNSSQLPDVHEVDAPVYGDKDNT